MQNSSIGLVLTVLDYGTSGILNMQCKCNIVDLIRNYKLTTK